MRGRSPMRSEFRWYARRPAMDRVARLLITLAAAGALAAPAVAEPVDAVRLLREGFPDRDYTQAPIKLVVNGQMCVLAGSALEFDKDGGATLMDAAVVRVTTVGDREVVETAAGRTAKLTFDPPVKTTADLGKCKIVSVETSDGRVIRLR